MTSSVKNKGISTLSLLGIVFITLKLCNIITWSWWWVTIPFWGGFALIFGFILIGILIAALLR